MPTNNLRLLFPIIGFAVIALAAVMYSVITDSTKGTLNLTVIPTDADIKIDDRQSSRPGEIKLSEGTHTLAISRTGFETKTITVNLKAREYVSNSVALTVSSAAGLTYLQNNQSQATEAEGIGGQEFITKTKEYTQKYPLLQILPYRGNGFNISYGESTAHKDDKSAIAIYVTYTSGESKTNALKWIQAQGYDPATYEIIYKYGK